MANQNEFNEGDQGHEARGNESAATRVTEETAKDRDGLVDQQRTDVLEKRARAAISEAASMTSQLLGRPEGLEDLGIAGADSKQLALQATLAARTEVLGTNYATPERLGKILSTDFPESGLVDIHNFMKEFPPGVRGEVCAELAKLTPAEAKAYMQENFDRIANSKSGDGEIDMKDLQDAFKNSTDPKERAILVFIMANMAELRQRHDDSWVDSVSDVTRDDIDNM